MPTSNAATPKPSSTFTYTMEPTHRPSSTPRPSYTPGTILPTNTVTVDLRSTLYSQILELRATHRARFPTTCDYEITDTALSPKGNWLAISCGVSKNQILEIVNIEGKQWILQFEDYLPDNEKNLGVSGFLTPDFWTNDDAFLFFSPYISFDGSGGICNFFLNRVEGLYRLDVNTGIVSTVLPVLREPYDFAFSPNGTMLAYFSFSERYLSILDLNTGAIILLDVGNVDFGDLTWSPDGSMLAYATCQAAQDGNSVVQSSVHIFTPTVNVLETIIEVKAKELHILGENTHLKIFIGDRWEGEHEYLIFDWTSRSFATPAPH